MTDQLIRDIGDAAMDAYYDACYNKALERVRRLKRLRSLEAPCWIIRYEQVMLVVNMKGSLTSADSEHYDRLVEKYVAPHLSL
jgi:hypothetical protein